MSMVATKQRDYLKAEKVSSELLREYEAKQREFLREQAGIMASGLAAGMPCPVCGSLEHPQLAMLAKDAPTEADVRTAKAKYDTAQKKATDARATRHRSRREWSIQQRRYLPRRLIV